MNMNIEILKVVGGQVELVRAPSEVAQRNMGRFLQYIAQLSGQHQIAFAGQKRHFDRLYLAAVWRPHQTTHDPDGIAAIDFGGEHLRPDRGASQ